MFKLLRFQKVKPIVYLVSIENIFICQYNPIKSKWDKHIAIVPSHTPNYQIKINTKAFYVSFYTPLTHFWTHLGKYGSFQQQQQFLQSYLPCPGLAVTAGPADGGSNSCQLQ